MLEYISNNMVEESVTLKTQDQKFSKQDLILILLWCFKTEGRHLDLLFCYLAQCFPVLSQTFYQAL